MVEITFDTEIETPVVIHPCLPDILGLVILLGPEGRVAQVTQQMTELFAKLTLHTLRRFLERPREAIREQDSHRRVFVRRARIASLAVSKGPRTRLCLISSSPSARRASSCALSAAVRTASASISFWGLMTMVPLTCFTSTKSPFCSPSSSQISFGITT